MCTVFEYLQDAKESGYGVALLKESGEILTPYMDSGDYPELMDMECGTSCSLQLRGETYDLCLHSGIMEERYNLQKELTQNK